MYTFINYDHHPAGVARIYFPPVLMYVHLCVSHAAWLCAHKIGVLPADKTKTMKRQQQRKNSITMMGVQVEPTRPTTNQLLVDCEQGSFGFTESAREIFR